MCYCTILCGNCQQRMPIVAGLPCRTDARPGLISLRHRFTPPFPRVYPSPSGKGVGGISFPSGEGGQKSKLKAGQAGDKEGALPCEHHSGKVNRQRRGKPRRVRGLPPFPVPPGFSPRGCKGRSPLHEITLNLPLPRRGRGWGGISFPFGEGGQKEKVQGRVGRRQRRRAPPASTTAARSTGNAGGKPPAGCVACSLFQCRPGSAPGDARGGAPCIRLLTKVSGLSF